MSNNPFMPRPIPVQYPNQYKGMEVALLKNNLAIHDGHWYSVDADMNLYPIRPDADVHEVEIIAKESEGKLYEFIDAAGDSVNQVRKTKVPVPFMIGFSGCGYADIDKHYRTLQRLKKYGTYKFHEWAIKKIADNPTMETFGHSLEALGSAERTFAHWIEAGKEEEYRKFAEEAKVPFNWVGIAHI